MKSWKLYLLIILLSVFPLANMFLTPDLPHTSDGMMHLARFAAYYKEFVGGQFPVRWASQFNYGYGTPLFNFFYPLPYFLAVPLFASGLSLINVLKISFSLTYILTGVFTLLFGLSIFKDKKMAFLVAIMYQYAPFRLVEMLVRGNIGSLYSYMLLPILFFSILQFIRKSSFPRFALVAFSGGLLSISNNIIGFVFFAVSFLFVFFTTKNIKKIGLTFFSMLWGLCLAGFFLIPAILEYKYTYGYLFSKDLFYNHFPSFFSLIIPNIGNWPQFRTAEVPVQIGFFHVLSLLILFYLLIKNNLKPDSRRISVYLLSITVLSILFMQPVTKFLWEKLSVLRQFQFPWRLLSIITFTSAWASAFVFEKIKFLHKNFAFIILIFFIITSTFAYWRPYQGYQKISQSYFWNYPLSTNYFGEVDSIWMAGAPKGYPKNRIDLIGGQAKISEVKISPEMHSFFINTAKNAKILDRTQFYPGWRVTVDNKPIVIEFQDQNNRGLITFDVPAGNHKVIVKYQENRLQKLSDIISISSFVLLIIGFIIFRCRKILA